MLGRGRRRRERSLARVRDQEPEQREGQHAPAPRGRDRREEQQHLQRNRRAAGERGAVELVDETEARGQRPDDEALVERERTGVAHRRPEDRNREAENECNRRTPQERRASRNSAPFG